MFLTIYRGHNPFISTPIPIRGSTGWVRLAAHPKASPPIFDMQTTPATQCFTPQSDRLYLQFACSNPAGIVPKHCKQWVNQTVSQWLVELVVSTKLEQYDREIRSFPQVGVKISQKIFETTSPKWDKVYPLLGKKSVFFTMILFLNGLPGEVRKVGKTMFSASFRLDLRFQVESDFSSHPFF